MKTYNMLDGKLKAQHDAIKNRMDIVAVISHFETVKERSEIKGKYVCKCPFHNEKTASFLIDKNKGLYKCFGCGVGGDTIKFIQDRLNLDYIEAMKWLGNFYNLPIDNNSPQSTFTKNKLNIREEIETETPPPVFIPKEVFNQSLNHYSENNFVEFLHTLFEPCITNMLIDKYYIGTSKYYSGATVFWQVDETGNIRYGKVMGYNPLTGKRIKEPFPQFTSINKAIIKKHEKAKTTPPDWVLKYDEQSPKPQVLFGLHLLNSDLNKPVAIVESEKTAIVASVFIPCFIWMALGGKVVEKFKEIPETLKEKFKPLAGRRVLLIPDHGAVEDWQYLAGVIYDIAKVSVTDLINTMAKDYQLPDKSDLCDYLTSEAARTELINEFKAALIEQAPQTTGEGIGRWLDFSDKGLRRKDVERAFHEIIQENEFDSETKELIKPHCK